VAHPIDRGLPGSRRDWLVGENDPGDGGAEASAHTYQPSSLTRADYMDKARRMQTLSQAR
jgi:hypothetical protein